MRKPTLRQLEAFKAFVETGNVSRAAELLYVSQPAVSKMLSHFEDDVEMALIDRSSNRPVVTERGMQVYEEIDRVFTGVDQIEQAIAAIRAKERSLITVGVPPGFPSKLLSIAAQKLRADHPKISVSFFVRSSEFISHGILSRKMDLGLIALNLDHPNVRSDPFFDDDMVVVMHPDHPLAEREAVHIKDLQGEKIVAFTPGSLSRVAMDRACANEDFEPDIVLQATTAQNCCAFIADGLGIGIMSPLFVHDHIGELVCRPLNPSLLLRILAVRPVDRSERRAVGAVLNALEAARDALIVAHADR
ncbi:MAG: LysR substrate-binding domain-containing protein [Pseudomonadota bacterium]